MKRKATMYLSILIIGLGLGLTSFQANALNCDGRVTQVLSGNAYCSNGQRVGFFWTGGGTWACSANQKMDALIMLAYATGKPISVRDSRWSSCSPGSGSVPDHIWFR